MAKKTISFDTPFRKGEKVTATMDLPGVPEGTGGRVKVVNGLTWKRYWVFFDNGINHGSIDHHALVRTAHWADYQTRRAEASTEVAGAVLGTGSADGPAEAAPADAAAAGGSRVPEHLLERTKKRKEALGIS